MTVLMESVQRQDMASVILFRSNLRFRRTMSLSYRRYQMEYGCT
jgi:hypothetical protein